MKNLSKIWDAWEISDGVMVGEFKSHGRVTVEKDWQLNVTAATYGLSNRGPYRWWQREDNSQVETEILNVEQVNIRRSIDSDTASCDITIANQEHYDHGETPTEGTSTTQLGRPGYYTWTYGLSPESQARWGQVANEWADVLVPNALIRTYEGYGGNDLSIVDAVTAGNITLTGTWLVDTVNVNSAGKIALKLRDMSKLLTEQYLYPPLVPNALYPVRHCRYLFDQYDLAFDGADEPRGEVVSELGLRVNTVLQYYDSSSDKWYGTDAEVHGHKPSDSVDGSLETMAISEGYGHALRDYATVWWEFTAQGQFDSVFVQPWLGNYEMYISVWENGAWVEGPGVVPHDPTDLIAAQPGAPDTGADINYVFKGGVPYDEGTWHDLPRLFEGIGGDTRIRISMRNLQQTDLGPFFFRAGLVEVLAKVDTFSALSDIPATIDMAAYPGTLGDGYWVCDNFGRVYAFGDARIQTKTSAEGFSHRTNAMAATPTGDGYVLLEADTGRIHYYGDAPVGLGNVAAGFAWNSISINATNDGILVTSRFGNAQTLGTVTDNGGTESISSADLAFRGGDGVIDSRPGADGYWILDRDGIVFNFGDAQHFGNATETLLEGEHWTYIVPTSTGNGYWILGLAGTVEAMGDAVDFGGIPSAHYDEFTYWDSAQNSRISWAMAPAPDDIGYWLIYADGRIVPFGDAFFYGSPTTESYLRKDGTYIDYADVVRELLNWSGFVLFNPTPDSGERAPTYGNIENTGINAGNECLSEELFDKRPPLDVITELKEIVGYNFYVDSDGAVKFQSPNWWAAGNFFEDGSYTTFIPEIDERLQLTDYSVSFSDDPLRSEIVIASEFPDVDTNSTTTITTIIPNTSAMLRGMIRPAIWANGLFNNPDEQKIMAELISLHIWFQQRIGSVSCMANPAIEIDDQVRVFERTTAESYVHYVRSVNTSHNFLTGEYMMDIETHWLGDTDGWVITRDDLLSDTVTTRFGMSNELVAYLLEKQESRAVSSGAALQFTDDLPYTITHTNNVLDLGDAGTEGGGSG